MMVEQRDGVDSHPEAQRHEVASALASIVICAFNNWPDLELAIESALNQSYRPLEVIVVDNSSTDATHEEVPRRWGSRVRYIRQRNSDCAGAYNSGFDNAKGEFIQFLDGDDVLAPNKIAKQIEYFSAHPEVDIAYGDCRMFQVPEGAATWIDAATNQEDDMLMALLLPDKLGAGISALGALFRRRALEIVGRWDEDLYCEDSDYWLRAAYAGCRFGRCPDSPMGFKRVRPGQKTANMRLTNLGLAAVWEKARHYIAIEPYRNLVTERLGDFLFFMAISRTELSKAEALAALSSARSISPKTISVPSYLLGYATIIVPGGHLLVRSRAFRSLRRYLASRLGLR